ELLSRQPPSRRAQLEIALADAQRDPSYRRLGLPALKIGARVPTDVLEHLVAVVSHHGFAIRYVQDLPRSVRSLTDLRHRRIYVKQEPVGADSPRAVVL